MRGAVAPGVLELQHDVAHPILLELLLGDRRGGGHGGYWARRTSERPGFRIYKNVAQDWIEKNHGRDTLQKVHADIGYHIDRE